MWFEISGVNAKRMCAKHIVPNEYVLYLMNSNGNTSSEESMLA